MMTKRRTVYDAATAWGITPDAEIAAANEAGNMALDGYLAMKARAEAAESKLTYIAKLTASKVSYDDPNIGLLEKVGIAYHRGYTDGAHESDTLAARVAELEAFLGGDMLAVTADGQQHHIKRGDWRPLPPPPDAATMEAQP